MEDTVRTMLQYKTRNEQLKQEKTTLTVAYEVKKKLINHILVRNIFFSLFILYTFLIENVILLVSSLRKENNFF